MVSNDTVRSVDAINILRTKFPLVRPDSGQLVDFVEYRNKDISVVIRAFVLDH